MNKIFGILLGGFFAIFAFGGILVVLDQGLDFISLVMISGSGLLSYNFLNKNLSKKSLPNTSPKGMPSVTIEKTNTIVKPNDLADTNELEIWVAGTNYENEYGIKIQKVIKDYIKEQIEMDMEEAYEGMTNKEILESGEERIYEATIEEWNEIEFIPDPNNPYDSNAIKIVHEEMGRIGYVPKELTKKVKEIIQNDYETEYVILGGKYKEVIEEDYKEKIKTSNSDYRVRVTIHY